MSSFPSKNHLILISLSLILIVILISPILAQGGDPPSSQLSQDNVSVNRRTMLRQKMLTDRLNRSSPPVITLASAHQQTITHCVNGFAGPYPCHHVDLLAHLPIQSMGGDTKANDLWGWTDPQTGKEYALVGLANGTSFVDLSDPLNPRYLGHLAPHTLPSIWRDIKVYQNHAFTVSEASGEGLQIFDLTQLRDIASPPVDFYETAHYDKFGRAHNLAINEDTGFAYIVGSRDSCAGGLHMINIQEPTQPAFAGCYAGDGYTHDTQCVVYHGPDEDYAGQEICISANEDTVTIVDVSVKTAVKQLSRTGYSGRGYTHQGWLTEDHHYYLLGDELDETAFGHNTKTYIWDVSDLDNPTVINSYTGPSGAIDHNMYVRDQFVYQANYQHGLDILSLAQIKQGSLLPVAHFDTYPDGDHPSFNGAWSSYPFFKSGLVIVNTMEHGLFVLSPDQNFTLEVHPSYQQALCFLEPIVYTVSATPAYSFSVPLNLSANITSDANSGSLTLPNLTTQPIASPHSFTVSLTQLSTHTMTVVGRSLTLTQTDVVTLHTADAPPPQVTLNGPSNNQGQDRSNLKFSWTPVQQASQYIFEMATDPNLAQLVYTATLLHPQHQLAEPLTATTYYWRVRAENKCGSGPSSEVYEISLFSELPFSSYLPLVLRG